jgi:predicted nucleotidyltransferase
VSEIVRSTIGAEIIRERLRGLAGVESALVFGSYASGAIRPRSDIDVLIVGTPDRDALTDRLEAASREIGREVNEVVFTASELEARRQRGDGFVRSIDAGSTIHVLP